jgi:acyl-CoA-dependent ceramide synthase
MFRYLALSKLCDATFVWFLLSWFVTRHVFFIIVIKSVYTDWRKVPTFQWAPERGFYFTTNVWIAFLASLMALQVSNTKC